MAFSPNKHNITSEPELGEVFDVRGQKVRVEKFSWVTAEELEEDLAKAEPVLSAEQGYYDCMIMTYKDSTGAWLVWVNAID